MSFKTTGFAILVAALAVGGGYSAWKHSGHNCCLSRDTSEEEAKAAETTANQVDDATLIASQRYCPAMPDSKLGEMGPPVKVMVVGKDGVENPVFVCCKGCKRKAMADPDKTLARVAEWKAAAAPK